jgi:hypothetical protein
MAQQPARAVPYHPKSHKDSATDQTQNQTKMHTETGRLAFEPRNPEREKSQNCFFFFVFFLQLLARSPLPRPGKKKEEGLREYGGNGRRERERHKFGHGGMC